MADVQEAIYPVVMSDDGKHKYNYQKKQSKKELKQLLVM
jgi:hypothetical protein